MKHHGRQHVFVTDKLRSYGAALKDLGPLNDRETGQWPGNRAENSQQPFRRRARAMLHFRRMRSFQKFVAVHSFIHNMFNAERALTSRDIFKANRPPLSSDGVNCARPDVERVQEKGDGLAFV